MESNTYLLQYQQKNKIMIYKASKKKSLNLKGEIPFEGNSIEKEMEIATTTKQPITKGNINQCFFTRRKDGVLAETDIRTDRFDIGLEAMTHANKKFSELVKQNIEKREEQKIE